jgi:hypothetical protein
VRFVAVMLVVAFAIGLLAGGSLRNFPSVQIRWWPLALIGVILQLLPIGGQAGFWALLGSFVLLIVFAIVNLRAPGFILILTGLLLNALVIAANHGMPVTARALARSDQLSTMDDLKHHGGAKHHLADDGSVLLPLADVLAVPSPIAQVVSVGDVCVYLGVGWFVVVALQPGYRPAILRSSSATSASDDLAS